MTVMLVTWCGLALALFGSWKVFVYLDSETARKRLDNVEAGFGMFIAGSALFVGGRLARQGMNKPASKGTKD